MSAKRRLAGEHWIGIVGIILLAVGSYWGLAEAPRERYMGEIGRILYIHVPTAWIGLLALTAAGVFAVLYLTQRRARWDDLLVGCVEVGVILTAMLLIQGSIWARPTWGVFWTWDPRLTTAAILLLSFIGVLALRAFVDDPARRARWTSVATLIAVLDIPIVYFSVKWWRTLHQDFSSPETVANQMHWPLRINAFALLALATWLILRRARLARQQRSERSAAPPATSTLVAGE